MIRFLALAFALLLTACSSEPSPPPITAQAEGAPALWKVTAADGKDGTAYLFGSVHQLPSDTDWQTPALDDAIQVSDGLVIEVSGLDDEQAISGIFADMGISKGLPSLKSRVEPALRSKLAVLADQSNVPAHVLNNMESWAAALTLASASSADLGLSREAGVETVLQRRFSADEKPTSALETITQQFGAFDQLPESEQRKLLALTVADAGKARDNYQEMLDAWMAGQTDTLLDRANEGMLASPITREALLDRRNRNWTAQIGAMIDKGERRFVAVGAGHLAGPGGVQELLKAKGYKVERVQETREHVASWPNAKSCYGAVK